jgi:DNA (cytosine-5)-methyltransferase 1
MLENVRGLLDPAFEKYRDDLDARLRDEGYEPMWRLLYASSFGVPQLRPRTILVALKKHIAQYFRWPSDRLRRPPTVGEALRDAMASAGWERADEWADCADKIAPTLVGGSHRHGGPDLGPTRARRAWAELGVNGKLIADEPPPPGFVGMPCLTVPMAATIQGFPAEWKIVGKKTHAYRQVGNAFPPPVAKAVASCIADAIKAAPAEGHGAAAIPHHPVEAVAA